MKIRTSPVPLLAAVLAVALISAAHADSISVEDGGQVLYDATTNLSWITNMDLAASDTLGVSGIASDGTMTWSTAEVILQRVRVHPSVSGMRDIPNYPPREFPPGGLSLLDGHP